MACRSKSKPNPANSSHPIRSRKKRTRIPVNQGTKRLRIPTAHHLLRCGSVQEHQRWPITWRPIRSLRRIIRLRSIRRRLRRPSTGIGVARITHRHTVTRKSGPTDGSTRAIRPESHSWNTVVIVRLMNRLVAMATKLLAYWSAPVTWCNHSASLNTKHPSSFIRSRIPVVTWRVFSAFRTSRQSFQTSRLPATSWLRHPLRRIPWRKWKAAISLQWKDFRLPRRFSSPNNVFQWPLDPKRNSFRPTRRTQSVRCWQLRRPISDFT